MPLTALGGVAPALAPVAPVVPVDPLAPVDAALPPMPPTGLIVPTEPMPPTEPVPPTGLFRPACRRLVRLRGPRRTGARRGRGLRWAARRRPGRLEPLVVWVSRRGVCERRGAALVLAGVAPGAITARPAVPISAAQQTATAILAAIALPPAAAAPPPAALPRGSGATATADAEVHA